VLLTLRLRKSSQSSPSVSRWTKRSGPPMPAAGCRSAARAVMRAPPTGSLLLVRSGRHAGMTAIGVTQPRHQRWRRRCFWCGPVTTSPRLLEACPTAGPERPHVAAFGCQRQSQLTIASDAEPSSTLLSLRRPSARPAHDPVRRDAARLDRRRSDRRPAGGLEMNAIVRRGAPLRRDGRCGQDRRGSSTPEAVTPVRLPLRAQGRRPSIIATGCSAPSARCSPSAGRAVGGTIARLAWIVGFGRRDVRP
jgi:hypothetical protein